ncbi:hypothetical protein NPIL_406701 [Nephila pilipes]|uniref:Uncharacterized protein n=1 Tax=Nephila pilipes TaxID=299642 RepID=A0A8X6MVE0_NEPPI|nr:hypothetical protein NPIL_406701 [Nephila pilipes]
MPFSYEKKSLNRAFKVSLNETSVSRSRQYKGFFDPQPHGYLDAPNEATKQTTSYVSRDAPLRNLRLCGRYQRKKHTAEGT